MGRASTGPGGMVEWRRGLDCVNDVVSGKGFETMLSTHWRHAPVNASGF